MKHSIGKLLRAQLSVINKTRFYQGLLVISISCLVLISGSSSAETSVWQVSNGQNTLYLGGTVHLLRPSDYPLPPEYDQAYANSQEIYFETDITGMSDMASQAQMLQRLTYSDGRTLKTVLNAEAYSALSEYAGNTGLPMMMLDSMKPGLLVSMLQVLEFQKMGFTPEGVDMHYNTKATADGKAIGQLETIEEQLGFLAAMGEGYESEFILQSLTEMESVEGLMDAMINAWRQGDSDSLTDLFVTEMKDTAPEVYKSLLVDRNNNWMPQVEKMLEDSDAEFVLVGAAHLVGEDGLVQRLSAKGYTVNKL